MAECKNRHLQDALIRQQHYVYSTTPRKRNREQNKMAANKEAACQKSVVQGTRRELVDGEPRGSVSTSQGDPHGDKSMVANVREEPHIQQQDPKRKLMKSVKKLRKEE